MPACPHEECPQTLISCQWCRAQYIGDLCEPCPQCCGRSPSPCQQKVQCPEEFAKFSDMVSPSFLCKDDEKCLDDVGAKGTAKKASGKKGEKQKTGKQKTGKQKTKDGGKQTVRAGNEPGKTGKKNTGDRNNAAQEGSAGQGRSPSPQAKATDAQGKSAPPGRKVGVNDQQGGRPVPGRKVGANDQQGKSPIAGRTVGANDKQGGKPTPGTQAAKPGHATGPYGAAGPGGSAPGPNGGAQAWTGYGPQGGPGYGCDPQCTQRYGQGGPQTSNTYGTFGAPGPVISPQPLPQYPQPGFPPGGYPPQPGAPGYGTAAPPGYGYGYTGQAAGLPSRHEQQFDPCTGELVCRCAAQSAFTSGKSPQNIASNREGPCDQSTPNMDDFNRVLKSLQFSYPANALQNCCLLLPINVDMANRTDEGEAEPEVATKSSTKSKRKLPKNGSNGKKAGEGSASAQGSLGAIRSGEKANPTTPGAPTGNDLCGCGAPCNGQVTMRSFCCNTNCLISADEGTQTASAEPKNKTTNNNTTNNPTGAAGAASPAGAPANGCIICSNGNCNPCYWPCYYYYNPYTGCYCWYPNPNCCMGCQNCAQPDPMLKIPEKPKSKEGAKGKKASSSKSAPGSPKGNKKNDRKKGGGSEPTGWMNCDQCCSPRCTSPKRQTSPSRHIPGLYPTAYQPCDCSPYGQIGMVGRIGGRDP